MRRACAAIGVLLTLLFGASSAETVFQIGRVDGSAAEFGPAPHPQGWCPTCGRSCAGIKNRHTWFEQNAGAIFRVGESEAQDIPRELHHSMKDGTRIEFDLDELRPLTLHVGLVDVVYGMYGQDRLRLSVSVNGGDPLERPIEDIHATHAVSILIDAARFVEGENNLKLRIHHRRGAVALYDYILLDESAAPPVDDATTRLVSDALEGPLADVEELVFTTRKDSRDGHYYANFGRQFGRGRDWGGPDGAPLWGTGGRLMKLNLRTGETTVLIEDLEGSIRDPQVHYDGRRIVFSWLKSGTGHFDIYEIHADGSGLRQITEGPYDDVEPTYIANGDIVFSSTRARRAVNCWLGPVGLLYRCDPKGRNVRRISANLEHDNTAWPLPDGRVLFTRWEYNDRSQFHWHHLWVCNPDGSGVMTYFGNMHGGHVYIDAKPLPGSEDIVLTISPGHGVRDHGGSIAVFSPESGPDGLASLEPVCLSLASDYRDPYPLGEDLFLANTFHTEHPSGIVLMSQDGPVVPLYELPEEFRESGSVHIHEVRPICPRPRERIIPDRVVPGETTGTFVLADAYMGRNMEGVKPGEIKKLLVLEALPKPVNFYGWQDPITHGNIFNLVRVLGEVPVEPDGSAFLEVPADRELFFVALDENGLSVKRMQSLVSVVPGEVVGCVGCHESRTRAPASSTERSFIQATDRAPSKITAIPNVPDIIDFPRDIQPMLDRHCVFCHNPDRPEANVVLTGDHGPVYSHSYFELTVRRELGLAHNGAGNRAPRAIGSSASRLMQKIANGHHDSAVSPGERDMVRCWIEAGGQYPGTYAALGSGSLFDWVPVNRVPRPDIEWPEVVAAMDTMERRCAECHNAEAKRALPTSVSDDLNQHGPIHNLKHPQVRYGRHRIFNLTRPEKARLLMTPLAQSAGGYAGDPAGPHGLDHPVIFKDTKDPDYQVLLTVMERYKAELDRKKRFDMPGFQPRKEYVEAMVRYGIIPEADAGKTPIDPYAVDEAYFRSFWPGEHNGFARSNPNVLEEE